MVKFVLSVFAVLGMLASVVAAAPTPEPADDPTAACAAMMDGQGVTAEGRAEMEQFMRSGRASEAMTGMMEMSRRMGGGDPMKGMVRMMEMMGSMSGMGSGMMGGSEPSQQQPGH